MARHPAGIPEPPAWPVGFVAVDLLGRDPVTDGTLVSTSTDGSQRAHLLVPVGASRPGNR